MQNEPHYNAIASIQIALNTFDLEKTEIDLVFVPYPSTNYMLKGVRFLGCIWSIWSELSRKKTKTEK